MTEQRCMTCEAIMQVHDECEECLLTKMNEERCKTVRTRCRHGHKWTEENTRWKLTRGKYNRQCRECERINYETYWAAKGSAKRKERYAESKQK